MYAEHSPKRGFLDWIALARAAMAQRRQPSRLTAHGRAADDVRMAHVEFDHAAQLYNRK